MKPIWSSMMLSMLIIALSGCGGVPAKPELPDGSHRVPVNQQTPIPPGKVAPSVGDCP
ncbi:MULTISPECIES: hypothetical protein [unclassified Burkholderia]|uniref:hypothetical protein n=1 Tax=unclassified Burkholderia TaxID=2613784 RepID=UPI00131A3962|nr:MULTISPECIES: hypothetical protein [unclassified Burkholderia]